MLPTQLVPDDKEGKILRVRLIQKEGVKFFKPVYLFDEGSTISWIPCGRKLSCSFPVRPRGSSRRPQLGILIAQACRSVVRAACQGPAVLRN